MTKILNSIWWRVLIVHIGAIMLWCGGLNGLGVSLVLSVVASFVAWSLGRREKREKPFKKPYPTTTYKPFRG